MIAKGGADTVSVKLREAEAWKESVTCTETLNVPTTAGVPVMVPEAESRLKPDGSPWADQWKGAVPPLSTSCCEYAFPAIAEGNDTVTICTGGG